jgi:hypothetical protein
VAVEHRPEGLLSDRVTWEGSGGWQGIEEAIGNVGCHTDPGLLNQFKSLKKSMSGYSNGTRFLFRW